MTDKKANGSRKAPNHAGKEKGSSRNVPNFREKIDILRGLMLHDRTRLPDNQIAYKVLNISPTNFSKMVSGTLPISIEYLTRLADEFGRGLFGPELFYEPSLKRFEAELRHLKYGVAQSVASLQLSQFVPNKPIESCSVTMSEDSPALIPGTRPGIGRTRSLGRAPLAPVLPRYRIGSKVTITVAGPASSCFMLLEANRESVVSIAPSKYAVDPRLPDGPGKFTRYDVPALDVGDPPGKYFLFGFFTPKRIVPWHGLGEEPREVNQDDLNEVARELKEFKGSYGLCSLSYDIVR